MATSLPAVARKIARAPSRVRRLPQKRRQQREKRIRDIQKRYHKDPDAALQAYWLFNGRTLRAWRNYQPDMIRRAVEFDYLKWPRKIKDHVWRKDVLDVGCGTGVHAIGFTVIGVRSYTGLDPYVELDDDRAKNVRTGEYDSFGWTPRQICRKHTHVDLISGTFEQVAPDRTFDVAVLHNVTEHLVNIEEVFAGVWERLRPNGTIVYNHHNFYCWNGHHLEPKYVDRIDPDDEEQKNYVDWAHLSYEPTGDHYFIRGLNRIRMDELKRLTERYFVLDEWTETLSDEQRGAGRLTDEIRRRYPQYSERELTTQNALCVGRRREVPLADASPS